MGQKDEPIELAPFEVVTDKGTRGYGTTTSLRATRINAPTADTPQSVVSLNQEFLRDVNTTNFADALRFVSGVTKSAGEHIGDGAEPGAPVRSEERPDPLPAVSTG